VLIIIFHEYPKDTYCNILPSYNLYIFIIVYFYEDPRP